MNVEWTGDQRPSAAYSLIYGAIAGIIGQTTTYPLDIVRRRMQTASMFNTSDQYKTILSSLKNIYRYELKIRTDLSKIRFVITNTVIIVVFYSFLFLLELKASLADIIKGSV